MIVKMMTLAIASTVLLQACAASPERLAMIQEAEATVPICQGEEDCRVKWEAAQLWVVGNSRYRMQIVTDVLLETYGSANYDPTLSFRVTKQPMGEGRYRINIEGFCANILGCEPHPAVAKIEFNRHVAATNP